MVECRGREVAIEELEAALKTEDEAEKNFHLRQALQLLEVDGREDSDTRGGNRETDES